MHGFSVRQKYLINVGHVHSVSVRTCWEQVHFYAEIIKILFNADNRRRKHKEAAP